MAQFRLVLEHCINVDIKERTGGYWHLPVDPSRQVAAVESIMEARKLWEAWLDRNGLGSGNLTYMSGTLLRPDGSIVGRFSYNGRFCPVNTTNPKPE